VRPGVLDALEDRTLLTTWTVNSAADTLTGDATNHVGTLRFDLANAAAGDTIQFDSTVFKAASPQTITTTSTLSITKNLTITGPGVTIALVKRDALAGTNFPIFTVSGGVTASISGLAIESGTGRSIASPPSPYATAVGGGGIYNGGTLTVSNCDLFDNAIRTNDANNPALGGAIYNDGGSLTITGSTFAGNNADLGGAIYNHNGSLSVSSSTFAPTSFTFNGGTTNFGGNSAGTGGAIATDHGATISGTTVSANAATGSGGGLAALGGTTLVQSSSVFSGNTAGTNGGGILNAGTLTISGSIVYHNDAVSSGGGAYSTGTLSVDASVVASNSLHSNDQKDLTIGGAGLANHGGVATITDSYFAGNHFVGGNALGLGGGVFNTGGTVAITGGAFGPHSFSVGGSTVDAGGNSATDGGGILSDTTLNVASTTFDGNHADENGAAIYVLGGTAVINGGSLLVNNIAAVSGGGLYSNGDVTLDDSAIAANTAGTDGGGVFTSGRLTATNATIGAYLSYAGNQAGIGGGVAVSGGVVTLDGSTVSGNTAFTATGGGIDNDAFGFVTLTNVTLRSNRAHTDGGGIRNGGTLSITASDLSSNVAENGAGGAIANGGFNTVTIAGSTFYGNSATAGDGGVVSNARLGNVTLLASILSGNSAGGSGGVISNAGSAAVNGSTLSGNSAGVTGGAFANSGTLSAVNATIFNNSASDGGGVAGAVNATTLLTNVTLAGNVASGGTAGGLLVAGGSKASISNTIVAQNLAITETGRGDVAGALLATSINNLIGDGTGLSGIAGGKNGNQVGTSAAPIDPKLGPLATSGGATPILALLPGSPAIDGGSNLAAQLAGLTTDQRGAGFLRTAAGAGTNAVVDIGAFEVQNYVVDIADDSVADDGKTSLREALALANVSPTNSSRISFDPNLTGPIALSGGLELASNIGLIGPGAGKLTIQGGGDSNKFTMFHVPAGVSVLLAGLTFTAGGGTDDGGTTHAGVIRNRGTLALANDVFTGNSADVGGAVENEGTLAVSGSSFTGNSAGMFGGALANYGTATIATTTIDGNTSAGSGGAVYNGGVLDVVASTLSNNAASLDGGAVRNDGTLRVVNATLYGNSAADGGGISQASSLGDATLTQATVTANRATGGVGGGLKVTQGNALLNNTIVAGNFRGESPAATPDDVAGTLDGSGASNLFGTGGSGGLTATNGNLVNVADAKLGPLADNAGPTKTVALKIGSPAIDAGNGALALDPSGAPLTTDQRGGSRVRVSGNGADIGAFELQAYVVNTLADDNNPNNSLLSLREAIAKSNTDKQGLITFQPGLTGTISVTSALPTITGSVAIEGPGASTLAVKPNIFFLFSLLFPNSVFSVAAGASASISGLTITGGNGSGGFLFFGNSGGGINNAGTVALDSVVVSANTAANGGGIHNAGTMTIDNSTIQGNTASTGGGINNAGTLTITNSTISGNAANTGGGINNTGTLSVFNTTLHGNSAGSGGGLANASPGVATLTNATIAANKMTSAFGSGGGLRVTSGTVALYNSIVAGNTKGSGLWTAADDVSGLLSGASASNLFGTGGSGSLTATNGNLVNVADAKLGPLAANGGPTQTVALLAGSPAIDAGNDALAIGPDTNPLATDQRGKARKVGTRVDIGAYESGA
jgi:CSLREA domain-containing protein